MYTSKNILLKRTTYIVSIEANTYTHKNQCKIFNEYAFHLW